ncbi:hypothetical protein J1N35_007322 [Gossypium stocksii]|uniref:Uncharacterized protein n=1 Tax=Gossypium stocksii TaxID=47602 RepID=A0A9D3W693_9ROSI|nr:hypothetical protein J1N35_007322 [Gossypium stocksii]
MAQDAPHRGLSIRWGTFSPRELAQFKELLEKPVRLKPSWPDNEDIATYAILIICLCYTNWYLEGVLKESSLE